MKKALPLVISFSMVLSGLALPAEPAGAALAEVGPIDPVSGFPIWFKDSGGLALDLMEAADPNGISDPVDPLNPFSQQIGFNAEGFWWSADAIMSTAAGSAILVQAIEAAFAGEAAVDGEQSAFNRVRIRVDVPQAGTYTVTYPFGQKSYTVAAGGVRAINDTIDIGCFAQPGVFSCSQAAVPNFGSALAVGVPGQVGPFLTWDTFDPDPALSDPLLTNALTGRRYVGTVLGGDHRVKGSPTGNNFFRIEGPNIGGPGINSIQTDLFTVTGRLADVTPPVITVLGDNPASVASGGAYTDAGATALDDVDGDVTARITVSFTDPASLPEANVDTAKLGTHTVTYAVSDTAGNSASATRTVNVVDTQLASIVVTPAVASLQIGSTQQFTASPLDQFGGPFATTTIWSSSDPAVGAVDQTGLFTASSSGTVVISASAGLISGTATVTVSIDPVVLTTLTISPLTAALVVGSTQQFTAATLDQFNNPIASPVVWSSDNQAVATIDTNGLLSALSVGTTTVTATSGALTATATIEVQAAPVPVLTAITVSPAGSLMLPGTSLQLAAAARDQFNNPIPAVLTWSSGSSTIATVDQSGLVSALSGGVVTITASSGAVSGTSVITVSDRVGPIDPSTGFPRWYVDTNGLALDLMEAADPNGISDPVDPLNPFSQQIGFNAEGFWWSADATVGPGLLVLAYEAAFGGEAAVDGEQSAFSRVRIRVDVPQTGTYIVTYPYGQKTYNITAVGAGNEINDSADIGCFGQPGIFSCSQPLPPNFSTVFASEINQFLTWDTFNANPALSDPLLTNAATGRHYVGTVLGGPHRVKGSPTGNNFFRIQGPNIGGPGINTVQTDLFTVTGRLAQAAPAPVPAPNPVLTSIIVSPATPALAIGTTVQLSAAALDQNGAAMVPAPAISWNSSDPTVATVSATGLVTAIGAGAATISAASGLVAGSATVIVSLLPPVLTSINVTPTAPALAVGGTAQLTAAPLDQFGNPIAAAITWTSSDPAVATVSATGLVTAIGAGSAAISASSGAVSGAANVTVTPPAPPANQPPVIAPIANQTTQVDKEIKFVVAAFDPDGDPISYSLLGAPAGATIDEEGEFRWDPVAVGVFNISVQVADGLGGTAAASFTATVGAKDSAAIIGGGGGGGGPRPPEVTAVNVPLNIDKKQSGKINTTLPSGSQVNVSVPTGAVKDPTTFSVSPGSLTAQNTPQNTTGAILVGNQVFNITAADPKNNPVRTFGGQLIISLTVPAAISNPANAGVYYFDEAANHWTLIANAKYDPATNQFSFSVDHLTQFAIFEVNGKPVILPVSGSGLGREVLGEKIFADGMLVRSKESKKIFLISGNQKKRIANLAELRRYLGQRITEVDDSALARFAEVRTLSGGRASFENGTLLRSRTSRRIFILENGQKRYVGTLLELRRLGRRAVHEVDDNSLSLFADVRREDRQLGRQEDRQADRQASRQEDRQADRQSDRQSDR